MNILDQDTEDRPDLLDHREAGLVTDVKNQGHCGREQAFDVLVISILFVGRPKYFMTLAI